MSKIALSPNASGSGTVTITAPNTNTNRTIALPDVAGNVVTTGDTGTVTGTMIGSLPTGSVVQVKENTRTAVFQVAANNSYTDMGLGVVITPTSTSSKILVTLSLNGYYETFGGVSGYINTRIARVVGGVSSQCTGTNSNMDTEIGRNGSQGDHRNIVMTILDEPSTTSEITYRAEFYTASGSSGVFYNDTSATSTAIAMEIVG